MTTFEKAFGSSNISGIMHGLTRMPAAVDTTAKAKQVLEHETRLHENGAVTQALLGRWVFSILYTDVYRHGFRFNYSFIVELSALPTYRNCKVRERYTRNVTLRIALHLCAMRCETMPRPRKPAVQFSSAALCQLTQAWSKRKTCLLLEHILYMSGSCCLSCPPENAQATFYHGAASVVAHKRYLGAPRSRKVLTPRLRQAAHAVHQCLLAQIASVFVVYQHECCKAAEACVHHRTYSTTAQVAAVR